MLCRWIDSLQWKKLRGSHIHYACCVLHLEVLICVLYVQRQQRTPSARSLLFINTEGVFRIIFPETTYKCEFWWPSWAPGRLCDNWRRQGGERKRDRKSRKAETNKVILLPKALLQFNCLFTHSLLSVCTEMFPVSINLAPVLVRWTVRWDDLDNFTKHFCQLTGIPLVLCRSQSPWLSLWVLCVREREMVCQTFGELCSCVHTK